MNTVVNTVVKVPCERYKRRMTSKLLKDYTEIMRVWEETLTSQKIDYAVAYGTALGLHRHGGFIPWDDDIDLLIRAKDAKRIQTAIKSPLCTHKFWGGFKVFKCDSPKAGKYAWGYPFMDVFLDTHKRNRANSKPEIMFPSVPVVIEGIRMRAPKNLKLHIKLKFKDTTKCMSPHWDHAAESGLKRVTFPCKDVMKQCYPTPSVPTVLPNHKGPLLALSVWDKLATEHNIPYRLEFGSLLGYVRTGAMIEHDTDVDLLIDKNSIAVLEQLVGKGVFYDAGNHPPFSRELIQAAAKKPWKEEMAVRVLVRKSHALDLGSVKRRSCQNKVVTRQMDKCSFKGPIARIIYFGKTTSFAELYMAGCEYHAPKGKYKSWTCRKSTQDCSYCPSTHARAGSLLEKSGGKLKRCTFSGVETWCPASLEWSQKRVKDYYGAGWAVLDKTQKHANGGKVKKNICEDTRFTLGEKNFRKPDFSFQGPWGDKLFFTAGVHGKCDLVGNHCEKIQSGDSKVPDRWLVDFLEVSMKNCDNCLSFDFGSNLGLVMLSLLSSGSSVVAVEPQLDLCCASRVSASAFPDKFTLYCGGVKPSHDSNKNLKICSSKRGHRAGWIPKKNQLPELHKSLGLPQCYSSKLFPLKQVITKGVQKYGNKIHTIKTDTDSVDCRLLREILDLDIDFVSITLEVTYNIDGCHKIDDFMYLMKRLDDMGYDKYHTPAQGNQYVDSYRHPDASIVAEEVHLKNSRVWKIKEIASMTKKNKQSFHKLRKKFQMFATRHQLKPHFSFIFNNIDENPDLKNKDYENILKSNIKAVERFGYKATMWSNTLTWGKSFNFAQMCKNSPLDAAIYNRIMKSSHPMVHYADVLRILILWRQGGSYLDGDALMQNNVYVEQAIQQNKMLMMRSPNGHRFCPLKWGCIDYKGETFYISNGLLHNFEPKSFFLTRILEEMPKKYDPNAWSSIGPHLLTYVWKGLSKKQKERFLLVEWKNIYGKNCKTCDFKEYQFQ